MRHIDGATGTLAVAVALNVQALAQQPGTAPQAPPRANRTQPAPSQAALPPLTPDAQQLLDQWKQNQASVIEQLRLLQRAYRDDGRAEDAAAIAAEVRVLRARAQP